MSPTGPNKYLGGITPIKTDHLELHLFKVKNLKRLHRKIWKTKLKQRAITRVKEGQGSLTKVKLDL